jgi:hypothetical protein
VDRLDNGLIDGSWNGRLPPEIADRLDRVIDERRRDG